MVIVSFSSKNQGNCDQISDFIASVCTYPTRIYRFTNFIIHPCGGCRYECFANNRSCPYIDDMEYAILDQICASSMTYFVLPNYCDYPCANFFIFNEKSQCYFQNHEDRLETYLNVPKQFIVVSNTGKSNFVEAMRQHINGAPEILFLSAKQYGKMSIAGNILESKEAKADIRRFLKTSAFRFSNAESN